MTMGLQIAHALGSPRMRIRPGRPLEIAGHGFYVEGEVAQGTWTFVDGTIGVRTDQGREVFGARLDDAEA